MSCGEQSATGRVLSIQVHELPGCGVPAELLRESLKLTALGDFPPTNQSAEVLPLDRDGAPLAFPLETRAVEARLGDGQRAYTGYAERRGQGNVDLTLWPELETCTLFRPDGALGYPGKGGGQALGYSSTLGLLLSAGGNDPLVSDALVGALTFDPQSGVLTPIDASGGQVLLAPRAFATVTELGDKLLVAGGHDPVFGVAEAALEPRDTAELFDPAVGGFQAEPVSLLAPRTRHAAITLPSGDALLVGGRSTSGGESYAQTRLERISKATRRSDISRTASITGRIAPKLVRLTDGRIFVGGGLTVSELPVAEPVGEWLLPDGSDHADPGVLSADVVPPRFDRAFVATPGGGLLAVGGCEAREPASKTEALECNAACARGCPPRNGYDAWWVDDQGQATPVALDAEGGIAAPHPILLPGSDGAPWLVATAARDPRTPRLFRFNPWTSSFVVASGTEEIAHLPSGAAPDPVVIDSDAFIWLRESGERSELMSLRLGTRNRYAQDTTLVSLSDPLDSSRPLHLAPDRPLGDLVGYDGRALELRAMEGRTAVTVLVTDADYADLTLTMRLGSGPPPLVMLGGAEYGGPDCPWGDRATSDPTVAMAPTLRRRGDEVELSYGGHARICGAASPGRVTVGLRGSPLGVSRIQQLEILRSAE